MTTAEAAPPVAPPTPKPPDRPATRRLHPLPLRVMHWINAITIVFMILSGWKIYEDEVIFGWLHFPDWLTIGPWAQHGLQVHFFFMWIFVLNGIAYLSYGFATSRFRRMLLPIRIGELLENIKDALRFKLVHEDTTRYNAVQKSLYIGVVCAGILIVISGLALWKPIQLSELVALFGSFQNVRLVHFLCMTAIFGFLCVHVALALLVPKTIVAMVGGGPLVAVADRPSSDVPPAAAAVDAS
jgi:thiosulfate reductase cytochrome b subunit